MTTTLRSTRVLTPAGLAPAAVQFGGEKITAILPHDSPQLPADPTDLGDLVLMPGLVDCHVHINEPGRTEWEGFETATRAAAAGGVTSLVDMPLNCDPVTTTSAAFATKLDVCSPKLFVDCGFWGGVVPGNADELAGLAKAGVLGAKCFLVHSGIDDFPNVEVADLMAAMPVMKSVDLPLLVHAELDLGAPQQKQSNQDYGAWLHSRPKAWEDQAIRLMIDLCRKTGCPVHIVHLSSASAIPLLREARAQGLPVSVETCPHYLCLTAEEAPRGDTRYKCAPPIRENDNREGLWAALAEGVIDFVVTDHSPCTPGLKCLDSGDFIEAWGGIASLQLGLPALWTEAHQRGHSVEDIARWMSERPARMAGIFDRKGSIQVGKDADFVIWDPDASFEVRSADLHFRHRSTPYEGKTLRGLVRSTYLRGQRIMHQSQLISAAQGRPLLHRQKAIQ